VGVEADTLTADRRRKIKSAAGCEYALQFSGSAVGSLGVEQIAVTPEADMLDDVQA